MSKFPTITITIEDDPYPGSGLVTGHRPWKRIRWEATIGEERYGRMLEVPRPSTDPVPPDASRENAARIRATAPPGDVVILESTAILDAVGDVARDALDSMHAALAGKMAQEAIDVLAPTP